MEKEKGETLVLTHGQIMDLNLSMEDCVKAVEDIFKIHAKKQLELPPKHSLIPREGLFFTSMPSYIPEYGIAGLKWVSRFPENEKKNIPNVISSIILNDMETGRCLSLMEGSWITAIRTGIVAGLTAKHFAKDNFTAISIIGAGVQSVSALECFLYLFPDLEEVHLIKFKDDAERFQERFAHTKLRFSVHHTMKEMFEGIPVILSAVTFAPKPFVEPEWLEDGVLAIPIHHRGWEKCAFSFHKTITDDRGQTLAYLKKGEFEGGLPPIYAELGEVISKEKKGRKSQDEKIIAYNLGVSICDLALARLVLKKAREKGMGQSISLHDFSGVYYL